MSTSAQVNRARELAQELDSWHIFLAQVFHLSTEAGWQGRAHPSHLPLTIAVGSMCKPEWDLHPLVIHHASAVRETLHLQTQNAFVLNARV